MRDPPVDYDSRATRDGAASRAMSILPVTSISWKRKGEIRS